MLDILAPAAAAMAYGEGPTIPWGRIALALLFCLGLAAAAIAFLNLRTGQAGPRTRWLPAGLSGAAAQRELELLERLPLTPTSQLLLVRCGGERLLLLSSAAGAQLLRELPPGGIPENAV